MDKQLLAALNKTSEAIEALAEALNSKEKSTSGTANALKSGDFGAQLKSINSSLKSIKKDTQEILKQNRTIVGMSQKAPGKEGDKDDPMNKLPKEQSKMDGLKKGLGIILLLAVAVLAIGLAFKLVGKIDVLSVIGLAIAITIVSFAFEKVAKLKLSIGDAFKTSVVMVIIAGAITASSYILKGITVLPITKGLTAIFIATMFVVISMKMREILLSALLFGKLNVSPATLLKTMVAISLAIAASSYILREVRILSFGKIMTSIAIAIMFSIISYNLENMALSVLIFKRFNIKPRELAKTMLGIAAAITASSFILKLIMPLTSGQLLTGIAISIMFFAIALNLEKIAMGVIAFKKTGVKPDALIATLVGVAAAITVSSFILKTIVPIDGMQFLTALGVAVLFALMSYVMPELAVGVAIVNKVLGKTGIFLIPVLFTAIALAIALSVKAFSKMPALEFKTLGIALLAGVGLAILAIVFTPAIWLLAWLGVKKVMVASTSIVILAGAITAASLLIAKGKFDKWPDWKWTVFTAIAIVAFGLVGWLLNKFGSLKDYLVGSIVIIGIAHVVKMTASILAEGDYTKRIPMKWVLGAGASILAFGLLALGFGLIVSSGGAGLMVLGAIVVIGLAFLIVKVSTKLNEGKYEKIPGLRWTTSVIAALTAFGVFSTIAGLAAINPLFWVGFLVINKLANVIVETAEVLAKGNYDLKGFASWAAGTVLLFATFSPLILVLGAVAAASAALGFFTGINPFESGKAAFISIAETIVAVSYELKKGTYSGGPTVEWAKSVAIALGAFAPVYKMLVDNAIMKMFGGGGIGPDDFKTAISTITGGIVAAANEFADNAVAFKNGPPIEWARGVGRAIGAFAPVYKVLQEGDSGILSMVGLSSGSKDVEKMKVAIKVISEGIVEAAKHFADNKAPFLEGNYPSPKWGAGVGKAIAAFAPVFKTLQGSSWYDNDDAMMEAMKKGIITISDGIIEAGRLFSVTDPNYWKEENVPTIKWARGVSKAIGAFAGVFKIMSEESGIFTSGDDVVKGLANGIKVIAGAIADSGNTLTLGDKDKFKSYPDVSWGTGVKTAVTSYLKIFDELASKDMDAAKFSSMSKVLETGINSMANVAKILHNSSKYFSTKLDPNFVKNITPNIMEYIKLGIDLEKKLVTVTTVTSKSGGIFGIGGTTKTEEVRKMKDMGIIDKVVQSMGNTAFILYKHSKYFQTNINPNFMKNLGKNVYDYVGLALYLTTKTAQINEITGEDNPIDKIAKSMTVLATGYDKLAAALERYAKATAMVLQIEGIKKKGGKGGSFGTAMSSGGPSGLKKASEGEPGGWSATEGIKQPKRKISPLEEDIKSIITHLEKITKEDKNKPGLLKTLIMVNSTTNDNLMVLIDEVESGLKKKKEG